ncbi:MAG: DUF1295 domain-containing protein [Treponemataceae bacterium]|nr:DUF1295 domain-containing protein [Treponemataceae bacterium]
MILKKRSLSFLVIALVYVLAVLAGVFVFDYFKGLLGVTDKSCVVGLPFLLPLLLADVAATILVFIFSLIFKNASVYDPYWSVQPPVILSLALSRCGSSLLGLLIFAAVLFWGLRLTANWAYTFKGLDFQDWRYSMLHEKTGKIYLLINFLGIHLFPTIVVYLCVLPAVAVVYFGPAFRPLCSVFLLLCFGATVCQGIADSQMHVFRSKGKGGFIRTGLWKHSRHPNYACEILMWWGVALTSLSAMPEKWFLCAGAVVNTLMFFFVSIPMADKRQSRKPGFEEYKKSTRML